MKPKKEHSFWIYLSNKLRKHDMSFLKNENSSVGAQVRHEQKAKAWLVDCYCWRRVPSSQEFQGIRWAAKVLQQERCLVSQTLIQPSSSPEAIIASLRFINLLIAALLHKHSKHEMNILSTEQKKDTRREQGRHSHPWASSRRSSNCWSSLRICGQNWLVKRTCHNC